MAAARPIPLAVPLSATYSVTFNLKDTFNSVGVQYDNGTAIVLSEFAKRTENNYLSSGIPLSASSEWYVAGGWRFGKLTPLVSYAQFKPLLSQEFPAGKYSTPSLSLRYDVVSHVALKAQVSRAQAGNSLYWDVANTASNERVNVYSAGADFVF